MINLQSFLWIIVTMLILRVIFILTNLLEYKKFKKDASNGLSYEKMRYHIDKSHPRIVTVSKKSNTITIIDYSCRF